MHVESGGVSARSTVVDGIEIRYHVAGTSADSATPIVLVHGAGGSTRTHMSYILPMLARRHRVISIDLSPPADRSELSVAGLSRQVVGVVEQEVPGLSVGLLGYALGAIVCANLAGTRPDLVDRLVLINGWLRSDAHQRMRHSIWHTLRSENSAALKPFMAFCALSGEMANLLPPADIDRAVAAQTVDTFVDLQMDLMARIDIADVAARITAPTLVIGSRHDQVAPVRHSRALFGVIGDARYLEVTSGHAVLQERVAEILRAAEGFFSNPTEYAAGATIEALRP